jgi:integrase/recombinase XerD
MLRPKRFVPRREAAPDPSSGNPLHALQGRFLDWTRAVGMAEQTANIRRTALQWFILWCHDRGVSRAPEITRELLEEYQLHLSRCRKANGAPLAISTQVTRLHPVRSFCRWLPRRLPRWVPSVQQVERILAQPDVSKPGGIRDRAMLEALYSTALRRMELAALQVFDVDLEAGILHVRLGKGWAMRTCRQRRSTRGYPSPS